MSETPEDPIIQHIGEPTTLHSFTVTWEIDVMAPTKEEAARLAYARLISGQPFDLMIIQPHAPLGQEERNDDHPAP